MPPASQTTWLEEEEGKETFNLTLALNEVTMLLESAWLYYH